MDVIDLRPLLAAVDADRRISDGHVIPPGPCVRVQPSLWATLAARWIGDVVRGA